MLLGKPPDPLDHVFDIRRSEMFRMTMISVVPAHGTSRTLEAAPEDGHHVTPVEAVVVPHTLRLVSRHTALQGEGVILQVTS